MNINNILLSANFCFSSSKQAKHLPAADFARQISSNLFACHMHILAKEPLSAQIGATDCGSWVAAAAACGWVWLMELPASIGMQNVKVEIRWTLFWVHVQIRIRNGQESEPSENHTHMKAIKGSVYGNQVGKRRSTTEDWVVKNTEQETWY